MSRRKPTEFRSNGRCLAYLRVSKASRSESGLGLMAQGETCKREARKLSLTFREDVHHDTANPPRLGYFTDDGQTAFRKGTILKRAAGAALLEAAKKGDTIIIAKLDRGWRDVLDFISTANELTARGVRLVICDPPINLGTATGRLLAQFFAVMAEWESGRRSEAIIAALDAKRGQESLKKASVSKTTESLDSDWRPPQAAKTEVVGESGRIMIYLRCSHRDSAVSGLGLLAQGDICRNYATYLMERNASLDMADVYTDAAVSASEYSKQPNLRLRPAGKRMDEELQAGDHVIFSNLDRGFRSVQDLANTLPDWIARGIHVHFASEGLCMDDDVGQLLATVIVQFAAMQSRLTSDRTREARAQATERGRFAGGREPCFWRVYRTGGSHGTKKLVLVRLRIAAFRYIKLLRRSGVPVKDALIRCEALVAKRENRPALPMDGVHKISALSSKLPRNYERDKDGRAFPMVTRSRWKFGLQLLPAAMEAWAKQADERRKLRAATVNCGDISEN